MAAPISSFLNSTLAPPSLLAIVMEVTPTRDGKLPFHAGHANLAATLDYLSSFDPAYISAMHDEETQKPLTCSPLIGEIHRQERMAVVRRGERYDLRVTGLTARCCGLLATAFLQEAPADWVLLGQPFAVRRVICDPDLHPWSGAATYQQLWHQPATDRTAKKIHCEFATPTAFHSNPITKTLPQPDLVFGSLLDHWNHVSPLPLEVDLRAWCRTWVETSRFDLKTVLFESKAGRPLSGCTGSITYSIRDPQPDGARLLNLLADFAFYSGVGMKTTMGMGMTRCL